MALAPTHATNAIIRVNPVLYKVLAAISAGLEPRSLRVPPRPLRGDGEAIEVVEQAGEPSAVVRGVGDEAQMASWPR
jgi:hypothetical protein